MKGDKMGKHDKAEVLRADVRDDEFYKARIKTLENEIQRLKEIIEEYESDAQILEAGHAGISKYYENKLASKDEKIEKLTAALVMANLREVEICQ